jgi:hypothetical protein
MDLRDFIAKALMDVVSGVQDAQSKTEKGTIVPSDMRDRVDIATAGFSVFQIVDFEVTVRADEKSGREGGLSVVSGVFGIGAGIKSIFGKSAGHAATLRFRVPVKLPKSGDEVVE